MKYSFKEIESCNMCGAPVTEFKVMGRRLNRSQGIFPKKKMGIATTVVKCEKCSLIFSNPQPFPLDLQDHYGVMPDSYWTQEYINEVLDITHLMAKLKKTLVTNDRPKALDIGAGIGKMMVALNKQGFDTYGIEPSVQFYEKAVSHLKIPTNRIECIALEDVVFEENSFDFITFGAVLEHLSDPSMALNKAVSWLKPGGIIEVQVPSSNWLIGKIFNLIYKLTFSDFCSNLSPMHTPYHLYEFHLESFKKHALKNNYTLVDVEYEICDTFMPKIFDFILKPIMRKTNTGMEIYVLLRKNDI
jgi:ubiquinone/menaquinone biosynthesis C-methylase UbiE